MKFSIITVCFNSEQTIEKTLQSVLNQTYQDFEYIIIDGKSTDRTLDIIKKYEPLFDGKMTIVSEVDDGIYGAMNKGIRLAKGELVGIVNSDDYYEPDALEKIAAVYDGYEYSIIYGLIRMVQDGKEVMVYSKHPDFLEQDMIAHPACFVTNQIYQEYGSYSLSYKYSADYEFMLRMKKYETVRFTGIYHIVSNFSIGGASGSGKAYMDTLRLRHEYGLMSDREYRYKMLKCKIAMMLRR